MFACLRIWPSLIQSRQSLHANPAQQVGSCRGGGQEVGGDAKVQVEKSEHDALWQRRHLAVAGTQQACHRICHLRKQCNTQLHASLPILHHVADDLKDDLQADRQAGSNFDCIPLSGVCDLARHPDVKWADLGTENRSIRARGFVAVGGKRLAAKLLALGGTWRSPYDLHD